MKLLQKKLKNKKGFTLIEMLVVVAIIAILVAISIPMVSGALDKARKAADDANLQAAKSVALLAEMEGTFEASQTYYYDIREGEYVKATSSSDPTDKGQSGTLSNSCILVKTDSSKHIQSGYPKWEAVS